MSARRFASAVLLCVAGCAQPSLPPVEPLAVSPGVIRGPEERVVDHVFIVTDASRTMYHSGEFPRAKALTQAFVEALPVRSGSVAGYDVGTIGFGGHERESLALRSFDRAALRASVDRLQPMGGVDGAGGSTPLHHVIGEIEQQLEQREGRTVVVLLSDGTVDDVAALLDAASDLLRAHDGDVCFHAIQFGNDPLGARTLRSLAALSSYCGSFRTAGALPTGLDITRFGESVLLATTPAPDRLPPVALPAERSADADAE